MSGLAVHAKVPGLTILRRFGANPDGLHPSSPLIQAAAAAAISTASRVSSIFKVAPDGVLTTLHTFDLLDNNGVNREGA